MNHPIPSARHGRPRSLGRPSLGRLVLGVISVLAMIVAISPSLTINSQTPARALAASGPQIYLPIVGNEWPAGLRQIGQAGGTQSAVVIADRNAFVGEGRRVNVYAIDGAGPVRQVGSSPLLTADVKDLTPHGRFLFVRVGGTRLTGGAYAVFDIGDGAAMDPMRSAGNAEALDGAHDVTFHGETGYICDGSGVRAMDARDPLHMVELGTLPLADGLSDCQRSDSGVLMARCVRKCGNQASLAPDGFLWRAIDVRDPAAMRVIRSIGDDYVPGGGDSAGYLLAGDTLYLETVSHGTGQSAAVLQRVDISDPLAWRGGGRLILSSVESCNGFGAADGTRIYAGGRSTCVYDWSDAAAVSPRLAATFATAAGNMAALGDRLVVTQEKLSVFDVADVDAPRDLGDVGLIAQPRLVALRGQTLVTLMLGRVNKVDVSQPAALRIVATWDAPNFSTYALPSFDHVLSSHRLPVYDGQELSVLDLDHASSPLPSKAIRLFEAPAPGVVASQDRLAVVATEGRHLRPGETVPGALIVVQHDLPAGPRIIGRIDLTDVQSLNPQIRFTSGRIAGTRAYFTTHSPPTLVIVDVAQPSAPVVLKWVPLMGDHAGVPVRGGVPRAVAVRDGVAYVVAEDAGLRIVPVAVPADAAEVAVIDAGKAVDVIDAAAPGGAVVLHVADADGTLRVFDLADPLSPRQIDVLQVGGVPSSVTAGDDGSSEVWVAAQSGGVVGFAWR